MVAIGVDGCRSGWFYFELDGQAYRYGVASTLAALVKNHPAGTRIFVDIPIGLLEGGSKGRRCDTEARRLLQKRRSSVFSAPVRSVLSAVDYEDAKERSTASAGKALSKQAFAIVPKIREVDSLLRGSSKARTMVREVHPELCFWSLAGGKPMAHPKKTEEGFRERMKILADSWPGSEAAVAHAYLWSSSRGVARDDVVDAMVNAITASADPVALKTLPSQPERDPTGLPMEMVYAQS